MPTTPPLDLLDRTPTDGADFICRVSGLLQEVINYGLFVLKECDRVVGQDSEPLEAKDEHGVILFGIYMHIIEMLDGLELLISQRAITPAFLQLRSIFESLLYLEWILQKDTKERALAYLVEDIYDRIYLHRSFDLSTDEGKQLKKLYEKDIFMISSKKPLESIPVNEDKIKDYINLLNKEPYNKINKQYLALKEKTSQQIKKRKKYVPWYALHGGGDSIKILADTLYKPYTYWFLYKKCSAIIHGQNRLKNRFLKGGGAKPLRDPSEIDQVSMFAIIFGSLAIKLLINYYNPKGIDFLSWYHKEIKSGYDWLIDGNIKVEYKLLNEIT